MADARDLKSLILKGVCGFKSRRRQLFMSLLSNVLDAIRPTGVALDTAATEYWWRTQSRLSASEKRGRAQCGLACLKEIRYRMGSFATAFNVEVRDLVAQDVADYLEAASASRNFNNQLSMRLGGSSAMAARM